MKVLFFFLALALSDARLLRDLMSSAFSDPEKLMNLDDVEKVLKSAILSNSTDVDNTSRLRDVLEIMQRYEHVSAKSFELKFGVRNILDCILCRGGFSALFVAVKLGQTAEQSTTIYTWFCVALRLGTYDVCHGFLALNMPIIHYVIKNTPEAKPADFCGLLLQKDDGPGLCSLNNPRYEWQVKLPPRATFMDRHINYETPTKPLTIAVFSDAHIDPHYEASGVANCGEPTCCRKGQALFHHLNQFNIDPSHIEESVLNIHGEFMLNLSVAYKIREMKRNITQLNIPLKKEIPAGYWGDYRDCDTPIWAYDDVIEHISETHNVDVVYYMGDTIDHGVWETTYDVNDNMHLYLVEKIKKSFGEHVLVVPVLGNHETQPLNQFAPSVVTDEHLNTTLLYRAMAKKWSSYLTDEAKATLIDSGEFSIPIRPGLRAISLNSNVAYRFNWWVIYDPQNAKKHLDWLVQELYKAELASEKVHLLTHIPPGTADLTYTWTREYNRIINRFSTTIAAHFTGHTHSDEFKIHYNEAGAAINVAWGIGSVTTYSYFNRNYKIATFDPQTFEPLNVVNYISNLTEANLTPNLRPRWFPLYDMVKTFQLKDLSAASMGDLVTSMVTDKRKLLDLYSSFYSKISDTWPFCEDDCKIDLLCQAVTTVLWERQKCEEVKTLFSSRSKLT